MFGFHIALLGLLSVSKSSSVSPLYQELSPSPEYYHSPHSRRYSQHFTYRHTGSHSLEFNAPKDTSADDTHRICHKYNYNCHRYRPQCLHNGL